MSPSRSSPRRIPTFQVELDEETGQTVIKGMGELHLDILVDRMRREFNVEANIGKPQVAYRETIKRTVEKFDFTHKKQTGGSGQFAKVQLTFGPLTDAEDGVFYEFENKVTGGRIPREYIPSVDAGIQSALQSGILAGYPVVNVKALSWTAPSTTSTPRRWHSRSPAPWLPRRPCARRSRSSSSRSWTSRSVLRRSTWEMSSAT